MTRINGIDSLGRVKFRAYITSLSNLLSLHVTIPKFLVLNDGFLFQNSSIYYFKNIDSVSINGDHSTIANTTQVFWKNIIEIDCNFPKSSETPFEPKESNALENMVSTPSKQVAD